MKNLIAFVFILLSFTLTAQTYTTDQVAFSTEGSSAFQLSRLPNQAVIKIKGKTVKILSENQLIVIRSHKKIVTNDFDIILFFLDGINYEIKKNPFDIVKLEMTPDSETKLFGICLTDSNGKQFFFNHLK
jgi:hypothetical protein